MSAACTALDNPGLVAARLAEWLRPYPAKALARQFGCEERTAVAWKAGNLPQMRALIAMAEAWGVGFLEYVFAPVLEESDLALDRRPERIEREAAALRHDVQTNRGAAAGRRGRAAGGAGAAAARLGRGAVLGLALLASVLAAAAPDEAMARPSAARIVRVARGGREGAA